MMADDVTWWNYKKMANVKAWRCLIKEELIESHNVLREAIDGETRRGKLEVSEVHLGRCRVGCNQGVVTSEIDWKYNGIR